MMIQLRTRDAALQPSPMVDQATVAVAYQYLAWRRSGFLSGPWQRPILAPPGTTRRHA